MAYHGLPPRLHSMHPRKVSEGGRWYLVCLDDVQRSFTTLSLLIDSQEKPAWTFVRNKSQSREVRSQYLDLGRYSFTNSVLREAFEQDPERYATSKSRSERIFDAQLGHIIACVQICRQHLAARKLYTPQYGGKVLGATSDCQRQRLHSDFKVAS